jgi:hypothetical protein
MIVEFSTAQGRGGRRRGDGERVTEERGGEGRRDD